jgi:hypothetical protein
VLVRYCARGACDLSKREVILRYCNGEERKDLLARRFIKNDNTRFIPPQHRTR